MPDTKTKRGKKKPLTESKTRGNVKTSKTSTKPSKSPPPVSKSKKTDVQTNIKPRHDESIRESDSVSNQGDTQTDQVKEKESEIVVTKTEKLNDEFTEYEKIIRIRRRGRKA